MGPHPINHYYEINRRGSRLNGLCALSIWIVTIAAVWGVWQHVAIVVVAMITLIAFNLGANYAIPRHGGRGDLARTVINAASAIAVGMLVDWPLPCWLWPPFVAMAYDQSGGKPAFAMFVAVTVMQDCAGWRDGVPYIIPILSTTFAIYAWLISQRRMQTIHDMLGRSAQQHDQLSTANAQVSAALDKLQRETAARERVEIELRTAQQLEAVGRIAAGVAHEINTPIQFVGDNLRFLQDGIAAMLALHDLDLAVRAAGDDARGQAIAAASAAETASDTGYLTAALPEAVSDALDGVNRVAVIVASMRQFSRHGDGATGATDINRTIDATLTISRNEYKLVADLECELGELPLVVCNSGEISQVLLNIVVNAAHAVADVAGTSGARGAIRVTTARDGDDVVISISDTGTGISPAIRDRIFDPFFTTKDVGRGTGQGLAIARAVIERHHGRLTFDTELGRGTTFHVRLPIGAVSN